ncbi:MAG: beta-ketoacyl-ACP synthase II [Sulfobacillus sp.]
MKRRVVVTGIGALTPLGLSAASSWQGALSGHSGVRFLPDMAAIGLTTAIGGRIEGFDPARFLQPKQIRHMDRFAQLAIAAAEEAMADSGLLGAGYDLEQVGVLFGSGIGGMVTFTEQHEVFLRRWDRVSPFFIPMMIPNMASGEVAIRWGLMGPNSTTVTACASSASAVGEAFRLVQHGDAPAMLALGAEAVIIPFAYAGFCSMKALSTRNDAPTEASRPFDQARDGFVMGEGAGCLVMEELEAALARHAPIYGEIVGYGQSSDAHHLVEPRPDGKGALLAMQRALADADLTPADVDYINAHATSTPKGDAGEARAIATLFGADGGQVSVSSTKSMTGHLLGAAGVVELLFSLLAIRDQVVPPTINLSQPDADIHLDLVPNVAKARQVRVALSNSFGFGGHNVSLVVARLA